MRCYDLNLDVYKQPQLLATFTFSFPLECVALDAADRVCYVGGPQGVLAVHFYYQIGTQKIVNLLNCESSSILSCVEAQFDDKIVDMYTMGKIVCPKITTSSATQLACSMEGSLLVVGDSTGKCAIMDVFSKQPVKEIQAIVANETAGEVTSIILTSVHVDSSESLLTGGKSQPDLKIPNLQKSVFTRGGFHDVYTQVDESQDSAVAPLDDLDAYLDQVASEESAFVQLGNVVSTVKVIDNNEQQVEETSLPAATTKSSEHEELEAMKGTVSQLTGAYKDLRQMYDKLFQEHEALRSSTGRN